MPTDSGWSRVWRRECGELLANLRYDPDTIPAQRISIAMLLLVTLLFAIALAVIRRVSPASFEGRTPPSPAIAAVAVHWWMQRQPGPIVSRTR